jgi:hypothetical protein
MGKTKSKLANESELCQSSKYIPENFTLGGVKWQVKRTVKSDNKTLVMGDCSDVTSEIRLVSEIDFDGEIMKIPIDKQEETFFHELSHAILMQMGHKDSRNEHFVQILGTFLYQFVKTAIYASESCNPVGFKLDNNNIK